MGIPDVAQRLHWESEWSQQIGNPMAYDYGIIRECWLNHYLGDWVGDDGWVFRQHDEMRKFNYIGDTHVITGEVTGAARRGRPLLRRHRLPSHQPARHGDGPPATPPCCCRAASTVRSSCPIRPPTCGPRPSGSWRATELARERSARKAV